MRAGGSRGRYRGSRVPNAGSVVLAEDAPRRPIRIECLPPTPGLEVQIIHTDLKGTRGTARSEAFQVGPDGTCVIEIRPGRYAAADRLGRSPSLEVGTDESTVTLAFDDD